MSFILRPYQNETVDASIAFINKPGKDNGLVVVPTGGGKSLILAEMIKKANRKTLIFQPSKEILEQNYAKYTGYGYKAGIYSASKNRKEIQDVVFATIGSVVNTPELFKGFDLVIGDEAHFFNPKGGMYEKFMKEIGSPKLLGLTATPYRLNTDGYGGSMLKFITRTRPRFFDKLVHVVQNKTLFEQGYLAKLKYYVIPGFDSTKIKPNTTGADYDDKSVQQYYTQINFPATIISVVESLLKVRKNVLVFTRFVSEAQYLAHHVKGMAIITSDTPKKEREQILLDYYAGKIRGIANVGIMTTGIDFPKLETVIIARPTMSLTLWYQMIGRGVRIHPDKEDCWIIDMGDNMRFFGPVEELEIANEGEEKWIVKNKERVLTNKYFDK